MKTSITTTLLLCIFFIAIQSGSSQDKSARKSPPVQISKDVNGTQITIDYSQPSKKGRKIFGDLVKYGKVWRTGANETTWIEVSKDVKIHGKTLKAGKYGLHTIPREKEWVIIFNSVWKEWGSYNYKESEDALRVTVTPSTTSETEKFTIDISEDGVISMAWDRTKVSFTVE